MENKRILITGVTGQVGSYLAKFYLQRNNKVFGMVRRCSRPRTDNIDDIIGDNNMEIICGDLQDQSSLCRVVKYTNPDYVFNCAAQSFVAESFCSPELTIDITGTGVIRLLEAIRINELRPVFVQCSSSEQYGAVVESPQNENTPFNARSPYGAAKIMAHYAVLNYRDSYSMNNKCAIMYNNESPRRGEEFVTQKIVTQIAEIGFGIRNIIELGNMEAKRDWSHTIDIVCALSLIAEYGKNDVYVVGSGETHSVKEFFAMGYKYISENIAKYNKSLPPIDNCYVVSPKYYRPADVNLLLADPSKIKSELGWQPSYTLNDIVIDMSKAAIEKVRKRIT